MDAGEEVKETSYFAIGNGIDWRVFPQNHSSKDPVASSARFSMPIDSKGFMYVDAPSGRAVMGQNLPGEVAAIGIAGPR